MHDRYHSRFFVQVGHETTYADIGNHHFFTKPCHHQTYQNYKGPFIHCMELALKAIMREY